MTSSAARVPPPHKEVLGHMGRNAAIKRFDAHPDGQPITLFETVSGRRPAIAELLGTPWIRRASELPSDAGAGKRAETDVVVEWDGDSGRPLAFVRGGRTYRVEAVVQQWAVERGWWDRSRHVSRRCFRVFAGGGTFDLAYDRLGGTWLLTGIAD